MVPQRHTWMAFDGKCPDCGREMERKKGKFVCNNPKCPVIKYIPHWPKPIVLRDASMTKANTP